MGNADELIDYTGNLLLVLALFKLAIVSCKEFVCSLCSNNFQKIEQLAEKAVERMSKYEYSTFLVGILLPEGVEEKEDEFKAEFEITHGESIKIILAEK